MHDDQAGHLNGLIRAASGDLSVRSAIEADQNGGGTNSIRPRAVADAAVALIYRYNWILILLRVD